MAIQTGQDKRNCHFQLQSVSQDGKQEPYVVWLNAQCARILRYKCHVFYLALQCSSADTDKCLLRSECSLTTPVWCRGEAEDRPTISAVEDKATVVAFLPGPAKQ